MRVAPSARGGNEILTGRTLFVGCPFGASPSCCSAGLLAPAAVGAATFAFLVFVCGLDPTGCSPSSESDSAFRLPELTARFCGMVGTTYGVERGLNERRCGGRNRIDRARVMTKS